MFVVTAYKLSCNLHFYCKFYRESTPIDESKESTWITILAYSSIRMANWPNMIVEVSNLFNFKLMCWGLPLTFLHQ